ncbi:FAD:protein FMN transferase [Muribaculum sp.]|uniref:FAD:protein FMN transferase n=1 Tax=Muribaculum sp. TaxID=1918611 RepID=UPI0023D6A989|nr:FAD:protein FMN transferase [Muribaculum sp.]MDE5704947.1 FAD:protein FMN transferase [Muribaculum sp.]
MKTTLSSLTLAVITLFSWAFVGCNSPKPYRTCEGIIWSTTYHVTYASNALLDDSIRTVMQQVDHSVSAFNPRSIISAINRNDTSAVADTILRRVFEESVRINRFSHGAFDPTVGPLVDLWGFGPSNATHSDSIPTPSKAAIDSVLMLVGMADCELLPDGHVRKKHPGTQFNFSAIAKGYACDLVAEMLERNGVENYMVEIGGEINVKGESQMGQQWRVMIDAPIPSTDSIIHTGTAIIRLTDDGVATSGNYRNFHKTDAGTVGHTISPVTGYPVTTRVLSVTILAPDCITADALATACMVMPMDSARAMLNNIPEAAGLFVTTDSDGLWELHPTRGFPLLER